MRIILSSLFISIVAAVLLAGATIGCAGRVETMRYTNQTLPDWILKEWANAQDELQKLDPPVTNAYLVSPYKFEWIQLESPFFHTLDDGTRELLFGVYQHDVRWGKKQIIICCGQKSTVRHEAFHAIMDVVGDDRFETHYPDFEELQ